MADPILKIKRDRLTALLKRAYEIGSRGWPELAEETAEKLVEECIADLPTTCSKSGVKLPDTFGNFVQQEQGDSLQATGPRATTIAQTTQTDVTWDGYLTTRRTQAPF